jgi:hypothetical protein
MGAEAICPCRWPGGAGEVKALLETRELILRGALGRVFPFAEMTAIRVEDGALCFSAAGEAIALELGSDRAGRWAGKIANPPTLAAKLGLAAASKALVIGPVTDPALAEALAGATAAGPEEARLGLAVVADAPSLEAALRRHESLLPSAPIWIVHGKGKRAGIGDNEVRGFMRASGYIDTKISAVSATLSATRYVRR